MKLIVTGANGFVGRAFLRRLVGVPSSVEGATKGREPRPQVIGIVRSASSATSLNAEFPVVHTAVFGALSPEERHALVANADVVVHLAWSSVPRSANADPVSDLHANVTQGLEFIEECGKAGVRRFIFLSTGGTMYGAACTVPHKESTAPDPIGAYGSSKFCLEQYLLVRAKHLGMEAQVLRPGNLYGSVHSMKRDQGVVEHWMNCLLSNRSIEVWNSLDAVRDYVFIEDMIDVLLVAIERPISHPVLNVGTGVGTSLHQLRDLVFSTAGAAVSLVVHGTDPPPVVANILDPGLLDLTWGVRPRTSLSTGAASMWKALTTGRS